MADTTYINYPIKGPFMDRSVPENTVVPGVFSHVAGADGRYSGGIRRFPGTNLTLDLNTVTGLETLYDYGGIFYFKTISFQKTGATTVYRGWVIAWDSQDDTDDLQVDLVYTLDDGTTWAVKAIVAAGGTAITSTTPISCAFNHNFLFVTIAEVSSWTVYWETAGTPALTVISMGPGNFYQEPPVMTHSSDAKDLTGTYFFSGSGTFMAAYRFYSSTRGVYSALSSVVTFSMAHYRVTRAYGFIYINLGGTDTKFVDGDIITINGRTYEVGVATGSDVDLGDIGALTLQNQLTAIVAAINGDSSRVVDAFVSGDNALRLNAITEGITGNTYTLSVTEAAPNQDDLATSGTTLTGGGLDTPVPFPTCSATLAFPDEGTPAWFDFTGGSAGFDDLFDKVEVFRSIDVGFPAGGAILYKEQTLDMPANATAWDALTVTIGTVHDEALVFYDYYDPQKHIVKAIPNSGAIGIYQGITFMAQAPSDEGGLDTFHSNLISDSPEYFTTFNRRQGSVDEGKPLRYMAIGDVMILLAENSVTQIHKGAQDLPLEYTTHHIFRGLASRAGAHGVGNSIFFVGQNGIMMLNSNDMNIGQLSSADRTIMDDWITDLANISSGYDGRMGSSYFLSPANKEMLQISHNSQTVNIIENCTYDIIDSGPNINGDGITRLYALTDTGRVLEIDYDRSGDGTMNGLSDSMTLTITSTNNSGTTVIYHDGDITMDDSVLGCRLYVASGTAIGEYGVITAYSTGADTITISPALTGAPRSGGKLLISPVIFKLRLPPLRRVNRQVNIPDFQRVIMNSLAVKFRKLDSYGANDVKTVRIGAYRNSSTSLHGSTDTFDIDQNPADAIGVVTIDGVDIEPYLEHFSVGEDFELTNIDVGCTITGSRNVE